jgi:hypothetical protein
MSHSSASRWSASCTTRRGLPDPAALATAKLRPQGNVARRCVVAAGGHTPAAGVESGRSRATPTTTEAADGVGTVPLGDSWHRRHRPQELKGDPQRGQLHAGRRGQP